MDVFSTLQATKRWHYINTSTIKRYLSSYPYQQNDKLYAICPYCKNPVVIISKGNPGSNTFTFYAKHSVKSPTGFPAVNQDKLENCLLRKQPNLFAPSPTLNPKVDLNSINLKGLRKAFNQLTGFYCSNQLTWALLHQGNKALAFKNVDCFNFPFALLIVTKSISLNGRIVANPKIERAINRHSLYFEVKKHQVTVNESVALLKLVLGNQNIDRSKQIYLDAQLVESYKGQDNVAYTYRIFCRMFDGLQQNRKE